MDEFTGVRELTSHEAPWIVERLGELTTQVLESFPVAGGVVTVSTRHGVIAETGFGYADLEASRPASRELTYEIGSISKTIAGLVVAQLIQERQLELDEVVEEILPWIEGSIVRRDATLRDLLNHTSGAIAGADALPDDPGEIWHARDARASTPQPPRFHYSNVGYQLLGEIVLSRTGRRLVELETERVLRPLAMSSAVSDITHQSRASMATGYWPTRTDRPWAPGDSLSPAPWFETDSVAGNVAARASDMVQLSRALLGASRGETLVDGDGGVAITPETFQLVTTVLAPQGEPFDDYEGLLAVSDSRYGMGINVARIGDSFCVTHGGGMVGYSTFMLVDCTMGFAVTVLTSANGDCHAAQLLARAGHTDVSRRLRGDTITPAPSLRSLVVTANDGTVPFGEGHRGRFFSERDGATLEVVVGAVGNAVTLTLGGVDAQLFRLTSGRFVTNHPALRTFLLDAVGEDESVRWVNGDNVFSTTPRLSNAEGSVHPLVGRYRTFSPWYPEFRVIEREGTLYLVAPGGTEAPSEDEALVELTPGCYRVGAEEWLPERLVAGPLHGGRVVVVIRDGCVYSRTANN